MILFLDNAFKRGKYVKQNIDSSKCPDHLTQRKSSNQKLIFIKVFQISNSNKSISVLIEIFPNRKRFSPVGKIN